MKILRFIHDLIQDSLLADKMILLSGPRQVGKTTAAKDWLAATGHQKLYFNWDDENTRRHFRTDANFFESLARSSGKNPKIVFDEIHKLPRWKTILKGYYDSFGADFRFFVTGSARLELFQKSGDSMLGRYHLLHLAPLIPNELEARGKSPNVSLQMNEEVLASAVLQQETIETLVQCSGFPEPFLKQSKRALHLWHQEYIQRIVKEDLRDLTKISDFNRAEHLMELLPSRVGAPFSLNNLVQDLACSYDTAKGLVKAFEKLAVLTILRPYSKNVKYTLSKEPKVYLTDWTQAATEGARFENFVAIQLKTFCDYVTDGGWCRMDLFYIRDKQKHEVDFLITGDGEPKLLIEAKTSEEGLDPNLKHFLGKLQGTPAVQIVLKPGVFAKKDKNLWVLSANRFFNWLWI